MAPYIITSSWFTQKSLWGRKDSGLEKLVPLPEATWPVNGRSASSNPGLCPPHNQLFSWSLQGKSPGIHGNVQSRSVRKRQQRSYSLMLIKCFPCLLSTRCHLFTGIISFNLPNNQMRLLLLLLLILMGKLGMERRSNLPKVSQPASSQVTIRTQAI